MAKAAKRTEAKGSEKDQAKAPIEEAGVFTTKVRRETTRSDGFVSLYANDVNVHTTPWDVRMVFGTIGGSAMSPDNPVFNIIENGELRMSPQLAKRLTIILLKQLQAYEKTFGAIPVAE